MKSISVFCASSNKNKELGEKIAGELSSRGAKVELKLLDQLDWPVYSTSREQDGLPEGVSEMANFLEGQQAMVFLAPEYNGGLPPSFTNFIAWISRSGNDWRSCFNQKTAVIGTHSGSGGIQALVAMRTQLAYLGMNVLGRQIHTHMKKELGESTLKDICDQLMGPA